MGHSIEEQDSLKYLKVRIHDLLDPESLFIMGFFIEKYVLWHTLSRFLIKYETHLWGTCCCRVSKCWYQGHTWLHHDYLLCLETCLFNSLDLLVY